MLASIELLSNVLLGLITTYSDSVKMLDILDKSLAGNVLLRGFISCVKIVLDDEQPGL